MRLPECFALLLLWQSSTLINIGAVASPDHLRFQRTVHVVGSGSGMACAPLDASVLAHTASSSHNDLRLFQRLSATSPEAEIPFALTESGPEPVADTEVAPEHVVATSQGLTFDLRMPDRLYTEVRLRLDLKDFVGMATVSGRDLHAGRGELGAFPVYDLTSTHLGHWTSLLLQETRWPILHVDLVLRTPSGQPFRTPPMKAVEGAYVPPSRLRQTQYVQIMRTGLVTQRGFLSVSSFRVPAHVPVERVAFHLAAEPPANFSREVIVSARPEGGPLTDTEALDAGAISHVSLPPEGPGVNRIDLTQMSVDATLGATLAHGATVLIAVNNDGRTPLPIDSVALEMRERKVCFFADRESTYTVRYGDSALAAPIYDPSQLSVPAQPLAAWLGPESVNPQFRARQDTRSYLKRHPELFWIFVLASAGLMGGMALHHVQHRRV